MKKENVIFVGTENQDWHETCLLFKDQQKIEFGQNVSPFVVWLHNMSTKYYRKVSC